MKKKLCLFIGFVFLAFLTYIGFDIYQSKNMEIIPFSDITSINVSAEEELQTDTVITVTADVGDYEAIAGDLTQKEMVEGTLYIIFYKYPAFKQVKDVEVHLGNMASLNQVQQISIIYGDIYSGEGESKGFFMNDLIDHPDQEIIWQKGDYE